MVTWMAMGGQIVQRHPTEGEVQVVITGPRLAKRTGETTAITICGWCYQEGVVARVDGNPLTDADMGNALATFDHECVEGDPA